MSIAKQIFLLLVLQLTFLSCESTDINSTDSNFSENFGAAVSRDFIGQVVDTDNHPIQSVTIKIGTTSVQTDVNGVFIINGASVYEKFAYITAKKTGYIDGSRAMVPTSGKNNVRIMLLQDAPLQTIQSGVTSEVSIYSGTKVVFDGAFMDENGAAYSGAVAVSMFHLTPSDENISKLMPGMLYAQNENGQEGVLETFGMMHVELRGTNGQKLQIATGHKAQITLRIDDSQLATCPSTIPLWHFDEQNGYWKQEGSATKNGNYYVGNVSHFSWWNCDTFSSVVSLTVTVVDANGNPLSNVGVGLTVNATNFNSYILNSGDNGQVSGLIPANQSMTLTIYNYCGDVVYTSQIGPYSQATNLQQIVLSNGTVQTSKVTGVLANCDDTLVTNGYVLLNYNNNTLFSGLNQGEYDFTALVCSGSNNFSIQGYDFDNYQTTGELNYNFTFPETSIDRLMACNTITEFISYSVNGFSTLITGDFETQTSLGIPTYANNPFINQFTIYALNTPSGTGLRVALEAADTNIGNHNTSISRVRINEVLNSYFFIGFQEESAYNFRINKFGSVGDYMDVSFTGTLTTGQGIPYVVTGIAHVIRDH